MKTLEELVIEVAELRKISTANNLGRTTYPITFKKDVIEFVKSTQQSKAYIEHVLYLSPSALNKWERQIATILQSSHITHGSGIRYTMPTKIEAAQMVLDMKMSQNAVAKKMGVALTTISNWVRDYQNGVFNNLDNAYNVVQVTRKPITTIDVLLKELAVIERTVNAKKEEIRSVLKADYEAKLKELL